MTGKRAAEPVLSAEELASFRAGRHYRLHHRLGAHPMVKDGVAGTRFAVWAPAATAVSVIGDFDGWDPERHPLQTVPGTGLWGTFVPAAEPGALYKFHLSSPLVAEPFDKADPFAAACECPPGTASRIASLSYAWRDAAWMARPRRGGAPNEPVSVYEVHPGSFIRTTGDSIRPVRWSDLADALIPHVKKLGFTHVELMPVMEHPYYASWGYQVLGYFAPTARYGSPTDFMQFVDRLHGAGIGVLLDWVPAHFPMDAHGLIRFDGTPLFEHADPRRGHHPDWNTAIFDYGRNEIRSFLGSSAACWLERYHADGLRFDAVASMLYLDYSRPPDAWLPNVEGGRENLDAVQFLREANALLYRDFPGTQTYAEESTAWPLVSRPTEQGGLGFGFKWDLGWMHDSLAYLGKDSIHRKWHQHKLTFRSVYHASESFVLPLSHDEVVHLKKSLLGRMPGDEWQRFANLRLLYAWQYAQPGKKLLFMGSELAPEGEWNHDVALDFSLAEHPLRAGIARLLSDLNAQYRQHEALHAGDSDGSGFEWVDGDDADNGVVVFLRHGKNPKKSALVIFHFTPARREDWPIGVPEVGSWVEVLNTDASAYGGSGVVNAGRLTATDTPHHGRPASLRLRIPPLSAMFLVPAGG